MAGGGGAALRLPISKWATPLVAHLLFTVRLPAVQAVLSSLRSAAAWMYSRSSSI